MATLIMFSIPFPLIFNSCSGSEFGEVDIDSKLKSLGTILINEGNTYTQDKKVTLYLNGDFADEMYVTHDSTCSQGGLWESYSKKQIVTKPWTLSKENQEASVYVKFRTKAKKSQNSNLDVSPDISPEVVQESECYGDSIIHDNIKPEIQFLKKKNMWTKDDVFEIPFSVTDNIKIKKTICSLSSDFSSSSDCKDVYSLRFQKAQIITTVYFQAIDEAGNKKTDFFQVGQDKTSSVISFKSTPQSLTQLSSGSFQFEVSDSESGVSDIQCRVVGGNWKECNSKSYSFSSLKEGNSQFEVKALNAVGLSSTKSYSWVIDNSAPVCSFTKSTDDLVTKETNFIFNIRQENLVRYECRYGSGSYATCPHPYTLSDLKDGSHTFNLKCTDRAGNEAQASHSWTVDTKAPLCEITKKPDLFSPYTVSEFNFQKETDVSYECSEGNSSASSCDQIHNVSNLKDGSHTFNLKCTDRAGNQAQDSYSWTVDTKAPEVVIQAPEIFWKNQKITFKWSVNEPIVNATCFYSSSQKSFLGKKSCMNENSYELQVSEIGRYYFSVSATDRAGNTRTKRYGFQVVEPHVVKEQTFNIKKQASADILFVIDNSQSMANEQKQLGEKMNGFISKLKSYNIDWNIAFTSTDKYRLGLNGNVDSSTNPALYLLGKENSRFKYVSQDKTVKDNPSLLGKDVYVLKNQDIYWHEDTKILIDEQSILQNTILSLGLKGHGAEGGIKSLMYFLEHKNVYPQSDLLRENSHFIAIVLSDEDEAPSEGKQPINVEERAQLFSDLIDLKVRKLGKDKSFQFHSIVHTEDNSLCLGAWGSQGSTYMALSQLNRPDVGILPATVSSLCVPSYTTVLDNIAESIKDRTQKITLKCPIIDLNDNGNLKDEITITPNPGVGFEINSEGTVVTFEDILNPQDYKLDYKCGLGN